MLNKMRFAVYTASALLLAIPLILACAHCHGFDGNGQDDSQMSEDELQAITQYYSVLPLH
jgi:hypothetical protein